MESTVRQRVKDRGSDGQKISTLGPTQGIPRHKSTWKTVLFLLIVSQVLLFIMFLQIPKRSPEMEFLKGIYLMFLGIKSSLLRLKFLSGFLSSFFRFLVSQIFLKTKEEYGFLYNTPVEETLNSIEHRLQAFH
jgi:hypothetical protein